MDEQKDIRRAADQLKQSDRPKDIVLWRILSNQECYLEDMRTLKIDTAKMSRAIFGDEDLKQDGLIQFTHANHARIKRLERLVTWGTGALTVIGIGIGAAWDALRGRFFGH